MPELPEVETVVRRLRPVLCGRTVRDVIVAWQRSIDRPAVPRFQKLLIGARFEKVERRGKFLRFELSTQHCLLAHLRMSGDLIIAPAATPPHQHIRVRIALDDGNELRFDDTRKFGRLYLVKNADDIVGKLGPEPLGASFTPEYLMQALRGRSGAVKPLLLNQEFIAGLGNIYAVESLWRAGIRPTKRAGRLRRREIEALYHAIRQVLEEAVTTCGTDIGDGVWKAGGYVTRVYGRAGTRCLRCRKGEIRRMVLGQRGTEYCPTCQR